MHLAVGQRHEGWQIAIGINAEVQLDGPFGLPELGPGKYGKTQVNGGGVEQIELVFEFKTVARRHFPTSVKELEKQRFVQGGWLLFIHPSKGGSGKRLDCKMVELVGLRRHVHDDIPQALSPGQLADEHGHELSPAVKGTKFLTNMMVLGDGFKVMSRKKCSNLPEDCVTMCHGSDLLDFVIVSAKTI